MLVWMPLGDVEVRDNFLAVCMEQMRSRSEWIPDTVLVSRIVRIAADVRTAVNSKTFLSSCEASRSARNTGRSRLPTIKIVVFTVMNSLWGWEMECFPEIVPGKQHHRSFRKTSCDCPPRWCQSTVMSTKFRTMFTQSGRNNETGNSVFRPTQSTMAPMQRLDINKKTWAAKSGIRFRRANCAQE